MNKNAIKTYAVWARRELIERVTLKAAMYGIEKGKAIDEKAVAHDGQLLTQDEIKKRKALIERVNLHGFDETMEEVAYTWFNRFAALRFMEVNGYLPSRVRVFTDEENGFNPEILKEALNLDIPGIDIEKVMEFERNSDKDGLFRYLIITQCNALNSILPGMFQKIDDYTELLFPDNLLREGSVIEQMITLIPEEDWKDQVQIIGWLYQYYNTEPKDEVINIYKGAVEKNDIPAATQIFTPDWVVRYIVDNSLGKYWIERNKNSKLDEKLDFFVLPKNGKINYINENIEPKNIKVIDNCCGSGHFLVYVFDVLMEIYKEYGFRERDAAEYILENNIYGLDIDERARQLAYFSVMMKARSYNRRILTKEIEPHIYAIPESDNIDRNNLEILGNNFTKDEKEKALSELDQLLNDFEDGRNKGSIIKVKQYDFKLLRRFIRDIDYTQLSFSVGNVMEDLFATDLKIIDKIIDVGEILSRKYDIVVTNPPYLNRMNGKLKKYVENNYRDYKTDLFSVFMCRNFECCKENGYIGFMTPYVWMFIQSYENLREYIISKKGISSLIQMEYSAFEEATVPICTFVLKNGKERAKGIYLRLSDFKGGMEVQREKVLEGIENPDCGYFYETNSNDFSKIPGMPIAYWASENLIKDFEIGEPMESILDVKQGLATANNDRFLRLWHEVDINKCKYDSKSAEDLLESGKKWIPYNKGGQRRQWYGNYDYLVNWENNGYEIKNFKDDKGKLRSVIRNPEYHFKEAITWSDITSGKFAMRYRNGGGMHDVSGMSAFSSSQTDLKYMLGVMTTSIADYIFKMINPTMHLQIGNFKRFPVVPTDDSIKTKVISIVNENISLSKLDWDMLETSWDFKGSPLIANKKDGTIKSAYESYKHEVNERFERLKANEEELNRIFIDIYGLQDELSYEVLEKDITVAKIFDKKSQIGEDIKGNKYVLTREDVVKNFISYAVGCMLGRYSLDREGLCFAGGEFDADIYKTFKTDQDGIIPITDDEYFADDVVARFVKFVSVVFGEETLEENLEFIGKELKGSGSSREKIRNYFVNDFYKDHCKMYQKRPIYWQFDSGKKNGIKVLMYIHRYRRDMVARIRVAYVHEMQGRYNQELERIYVLMKDCDTSEKIKLEKRVADIKDKIDELGKFEAKVHHIADSMIELDLDDGVKENYEIFKDIVTKI